MHPSLPNPEEPTFLSLPDDIISKIFKHIIGDMIYTLQSSMDALNLARTDPRLEKVISRQLTQITPIIENSEAPAFSEQHFDALVRLAGDNLRELHIPDGRHAYVCDLPDICPNLEVIYYVERHHLYVSKQRVDNIPGVIDGANIVAGIPDYAFDMYNDLEVVFSELVIDNVDINKPGWQSCATCDVFPRLNLRKLSIARPSKTFFDHITNHNLEELHLYNVKKHLLGRLIPLLSRPLKSLTVTVAEFHFGDNDERFSKFVDALTPLVTHIGSLTLHSPFNMGLGIAAETALRFPNTISFPERATKFISLARQNTSPSGCTKVDLRGPGTFRVLSSVNHEASITLSCVSRVTVRDDGDGAHIIEMPLDDDFLGRDLSHVEKVYILREWGELESVCNVEWRELLADHKLRVLRTCTPKLLNVLNLSTERLELFSRGLGSVTDWKFLSGVRELYLFGLPWDFGRSYRDRTIEVIKALGCMVDAFEGELIWAGEYYYMDCNNCEELDELVAGANEAKEAVDRFVKRGGDAATLQKYIENVVRTSTIDMIQIGGDTVTLNEMRY